MPGVEAGSTFETFVVGNGNRLAGAAAWRVSETPGSAWNPLLLYGASGLGKTHLLMAIAHRAAQVQPHLAVVYDAVGQFTDADHAALADRWRGAHVLLLDDAQLLAHHAGLQDALLGAWDAVVGSGGQIVVATDRPPNEIGGLDPRLLSRLSAGLVADLAPPDHDTRVEIVNRLAAAGGQTLAAGVADELARITFGSVRELQGAVKRVLAVQELEGRAVAAGEVAALLGVQPVSRSGEFGTFVSEVTGALGEALERLSPAQRLAEALLRWEGEGYRTTRLDAALAEEPDAAAVDRIVAEFEADIARLRSLEQQIRALDAAAPELGRADVLRDPDMRMAAEALLGRVRARLAAAAGTGRGATDADNGRPRTRPAPGLRMGARTPPAWDAVVAAAELPAERWSQPDAGEVVDAWFLSREKVLWRWPYIEDLILADVE